MDEKEFKRRISTEKKAKEQMLKDKSTYDRALFSENKTVNYDPKSGTLKEE
jgi:hypothetical protein